MGTGYLRSRIQWVKTGTGYTIQNTYARNWQQVLLRMHSTGYRIKDKMNRIYDTATELQRKPQ